MILSEAIKSGRKFKRPMDVDWRVLTTSGNVITLEDLTASDYVTDNCVVKANLSLSDLETAFVKVNENGPPLMGRPVFREFVEALAAIKIK